MVLNVDRAGPLIGTPAARCDGQILIIVIEIELAIAMEYGSRLKVRLEEGLMDRSHITTSSKLAANKAAG